MMCERCNKDMRYRDKAYRVVLYGGIIKETIPIDRFICPSCGHIKRILPDDILPNTRYARNVVYGFVEGSKTNYDILYEDYPCEQTIERWKSKFFQCII